MTRIFPYFCIALILVLQYQAVAAFCPVVKHKLHRTLSVLSAEAAAPTTPKGTMVELKNPITGQQITLIGTAHLSQTSNDQVKYVIETVKPDAIMIELDPSRLERIGLTQGDLGTNFGTCEDIEPPLLEDDIEAMQNRPWWRGFTEVCVDSVAEFARGALTDMYKDMGKTMGKDGLVGGGEFLAAINAAKSNDESSDNGSSTKIVLGDRSSVVTIKRAVELAIRSGDPLGALGRLASANQEELDKMQHSIRQDMEGNSMDESELNVAMVEALKSDAGFRNRIFSRLEREVPEFTRAFLTERDYIMAEAIRRETDAAHVVAVVGLAHVPGMSANLRASEFQDANTS